VNVTPERKLSCSELSAPNDKRNARPAESTGHRPEHGKQKLIGLDDLIPKQNVTGGAAMRPSWFGIGKIEYPQPSRDVFRAFGSFGSRAEARERFIDRRT
jgi:hypothetical protein